VTIDVLPTIADVIGVRLPWQVEGRSLRAGPVEREVHVGARDTTVAARSDDVAADVLRVARHNATLFGDGKDSLYRLGPRSELLGRAVANLARTAAANADIELVRPSEIAHVRRSSGYVPAHIVGRLDWSEARHKEVLAIVLNGRIAAVTTSFVSRGRTLFSSLVDETLFVDGQNTVEVFAVRGSGGGTRLLRLGGTGGRGATLAATRGEP